MEVRLLTPSILLTVMERNAAYAMLTCRANTEKLKETDPRVFIEKAIKEEHESILEHITLTYEVKKLSRACLQELARHRHISLSVESTRHTIKEKLKEIDKMAGIIEDFLPILIKGSESAFFWHEEYLAWFSRLVKQLPDLSNDELKYYIPELWPTNLIMTANIRELRHIVKLRTAPAALQEFQKIARKFVDVVPEEFKYLLEDCVYKNEE